MALSPPRRATPEASSATTETRRAFKTTEFFVMRASIAAVLMAGYASDDSLDTARIWILITILAAAYMISRGLSKAGSYEPEDREVRSSASVRCDAAADIRK